VPPSGGSTLPGAGRGKPVQNKAKQTPQQQQKNKEKSIEQQLLEMQPSFGSVQATEPKQPSAQQDNAPVSGQGNNRKGNKKQKQVVMSWG
jgi:hypothetical protein